MRVRVVLDARIPEGEWGGVQQVAIGLAHGLSQLEGTDDRYLFMTNEGEAGWLEPFLGANCDLVEVEPPRTLRGRVGRKLASQGLQRLARASTSLSPRSAESVVRRLRADVVHFVHQEAFDTDIPSIYQPHDLQHAHYPEFFEPSEVARKNRQYKVHCDHAEMIVVMSRWGRQDLIRNLQIAGENVFVIPWGAPVEAYESLHQVDRDRIRDEYRLPDRFLIYPAQTWPHKNHVSLVGAIALVKRNGVSANLVCTGYQNPRHYPKVHEAVRRLEIQDRVSFLGWIPQTDVAGIYELAYGLVFPSLFEGWGMPVMEAFHFNIPVACSDIPVLREQAGDAAIYFQPGDVESIAKAVTSLWTDESLRGRLVLAGSKRLSLTWRLIAETFRAHYRRLTGITLDTRDQELILRSSSGDWLP